MAIHPTVYLSPDRHLRITVSAGRGHGSKIRVERDLVLVAEFSTLSTLESWLKEQGIDIADLIED